MKPGEVKAVGVCIFLGAISWALYSNILASPQPEKPPTFSPPSMVEEPVVFSKRYNSGELRVYEVAPACYLAVHERRAGDMSVDPDTVDLTAFSLACAR